MNTYGFNQRFIDDIYYLLSCNAKTREQPNSYEFNEENAPPEAIESDLKAYSESLKTGANYGQHASLESWISMDAQGNPRDVYPNVVNHHQKVLDVVKDLQPETICELGAGVGQVSKWVHKICPSSKLTCVESGDKHYPQMLENFGERSDVLPPDIKVNANTIQHSIHDLKGIIEDNSQELVYTCTVMMHLPYMVACATACEIDRICSKYVLHVENKNDKINCIVPGDTNTLGAYSAGPNMNNLPIDYRRIYDRLGYECLIYEEAPDPYAPCEYIYFLARKK
jgi:hypothetical protein